MDRRRIEECLPSKEWMEKRGYWYPEELSDKKSILMPRYHGKSAVILSFELPHPDGECGDIDCGCYVDPLRKLAVAKLKEEMK